VPCTLLNAKCSSWRPYQPFVEPLEDRCLLAGGIIGLPVTPSSATPNSSRSGPMATCGSRNGHPTLPAASTWTTSDGSRLPAS
jgi:hypothetical protein